MVKSKPFWEIINKASENTAEIRIYGDIVSEKPWYDSSGDVCPIGFADALTKLEGKPVCIRINSNGGNVFAAHAIASQIKSYSGDTTVMIDGLAASAATIIAMAGKKILMPVNAMMMIHDPMVCLAEPANAEQLGKLIEMLKPVKASIVAAYKERCKLSEKELETMMKNSTWLTAEECLANGFCDQIQGEVEPVLDGNVLVVNHVRHQLSKGDADLIKNKIRKKEDKMMNENLVNAVNTILSAIGIRAGEQTNSAAPANQTTAPADEEQIRNEERSRLAALNALDDGSAGVKAVINMAIKDGKTADEIKETIDAIKGAQPAAQASAGQSFMNDLIDDQMKSGSGDVTGQPANGLTEAEEDALRTENMAKTLQNMYGGNK